jgi:peptidoglycan/LPS O-acetylase OafA/YrhL
VSRVRFPLLDALRCVASLEVAFRHVRGEYVLDTALGVPLFLVIMLALTARGTGDEPIGRYAAEKAARLLVPWVRWSLVYVALAVFVDNRTRTRSVGRARAAHALLRRTRRAVVPALLVRRGAARAQRARPRRARPRPQPSPRRACS